MQSGEVSPLLQSIKRLVEDPRNSPYLPTMPQDDSVDIVRAAEELGRERGAVTKWYRCPNGHYFGVGDCGIPVGKKGGQGNCPDCKELVGGQGYNAFVRTGLPADKVPQPVFEDQTQEGHILGPAGQMRAVTERELSGLEVAIAR